MKYVDPLGLNHKDLGPGGATAPANKPSAVDKTTSKVVGENTGNNTKYSDCPQGTGNGRRNIYYAGNANSLNIPVNIARQIASAGVGLLPIVGDVKDVQEVLTGYDIISGEKLTWIDRGITFICVFVPIVSGKAAREGLGLVDEGIDLAKTTLKNADEVVERTVKTDDAFKIDLQLFAGGKIKFPDAKWYERTYGLGKGRFHEVKGDILKQLTSKDSPYKALMKKVGDNPDIGLDDLGNIVIKSRKNGVQFETDLSFDSFLP
ncbi:pre-toxin TG domain-containing protein [Lutispora saccharofermentans]|uniref:Pre-toxin TG domain-containing protein n=1 Tax=Lutispora saccharofermentans TaxID=3024236 RepID=A0ABT1NG19_9FIRM|nr:pre-toxin TG domain-containing protein [Lutispora saccharofermentans]MCQ1530217.1 pre-toxin TG domain-containing protein [Lutispora saccharofermentans]